MGANFSASVSEATASATRPARYSRMPILCNALDLSRCGAVAAEPDGWGAVYPTLSAVAGGIGKGLASARILGRCFIAGAFLQNASRGGLAGLSGRRVAETMRSPAFAGRCDLWRRAAEITLDKRGLARGKRRHGSFSSAKLDGSGAADVLLSGGRDADSADFTQLCWRGDFPRLS